MDTEITVTLEATLEKRGYRGRVVAIQHLHDLWEGIERHHRTGRIDEELYQERLAGFQFHPPESLPNARSVILLAYAQLQTRLTFSRNKHQIQALIPHLLLLTASRQTGRRNPYRALKVGWLSSRKNRITQKVVGCLQWFSPIRPK